MKLRLTPLNIVTALSFAFLGYILIVPGAHKSPAAVTMNVMAKLLLIALVIVSFITDLIFRFTLKELKRIWIVESVFIMLTIIMILILRK